MIPAFRLFLCELLRLIAPVLLIFLLAKVLS
jgi:hypothetical protein